MTVRLPAIPPDAVLWRVDPSSGQPVATTFSRRRRRLGLVLPLNRGVASSRIGYPPVAGESEGPVPVSRLAGAGPATPEVSEDPAVLLLRPGAAGSSGDPPEAT